MIDRIAGPLDGRQAAKMRMALVTARGALELDEDMPVLVAAMRDAGADVETPCWDDPDVDWTRYGAALLRSTWDYADRIDAFLAWCDRCSLLTRLLNASGVVRWNTDKHYLAHLARAGVAVVPTRFVEAGADARTELEAFLADGPQSLTIGRSEGFDEFVVKPAIGAGSRDAARYPRSELERALEHVDRLIAAGRSLLLQPYLSRVDEHGETAVLYLGGRFSHAIRKGPLLRRGAAMVEGLFAPEEIRPREAERDELDVAAAAYAAIPFAAPCYARIDLLRDTRGTPVVLELELTEPSLFLAHAPGAAAAFATHLVQRVRESTATG